MGKGLDVFLGWTKSNMEATWEKVETEADAVSRSIDHLKQVHNLDEVDIETSTELSPGTWELVARSGRFTFDVLVKSEHFLLVKAQRREARGLLKCERWRLRLMLVGPFREFRGSS